MNKANAQSLDTLSGVEELVRVHEAPTEEVVAPSKAQPCHLAIPSSPFIPMRMPIARPFAAPPVITEMPAPATLPNPTPMRGSPFARSSVSPFVRSAGGPGIGRADVEHELGRDVEREVARSNRSATERETVKAESSTKPRKRFVKLASLASLVGLGGLLLAFEPVVAPPMATVMGPVVTSVPSIDFESDTLPWNKVVTLGAPRTPSQPRLDALARSTENANQYQLVVEEPDAAVVHARPVVATTQSRYVAPRAVARVAPAGNSISLSRELLSAL